MKWLHPLRMQIYSPFYIWRVLISIVTQNAFPKLQSFPLLNYIPTYFSRDHLHELLSLLAACELSLL